MVFVGNINQSVDVLLNTSHLFEPFPAAMAYETAFLDPNGTAMCGLGDTEVQTRVLYKRLWVLLPTIFPSS
jgi:predicted ATP-dependent Lon-type protease